MPTPLQQSPEATGWRACNRTGKVSHRHYKDASRAVAKMRKVLQFIGKRREQFKTYRCRWCGLWHIGGGLTPPEHRLRRPRHEPRIEDFE